jgi:hypothetical protein
MKNSSLMSCLFFSLFFFTGTVFGQSVDVTIRDFLNKQKEIDSLCTRYIDGDYSERLFIQILGKYNDINELYNRLDSFDDSRLSESQRMEIIECKLKMMGIQTNAMSVVALHEIPVGKFVEKYDGKEVLNDQRSTDIFQLGKTLYYGKFTAIEQEEHGYMLVIVADNYAKGKEIVNRYFPKVSEIPVDVAFVVFTMDMRMLMRSYEGDVEN